MNIEEIAFKDRKNLVKLNENDLLDIIEFLQQDRKQWINQFTQTHNESVKIQEENQKLEQALDEIEKYIENHKRESKTRIYGLGIPEFIFNGNIEDIEEIVKKAKGDDK